MNPLRILVVDDEELSRRALSSLVARFDGQVELVGEASDGQEAVAMATELQPDLIIMDIRMPELNGVDAARIIRDRDAAIRVVFLTAHDEFEYAQEAVHLGAMGYLLKPVQREDLFNVFQEYLHRQNSTGTNLPTSRDAEAQSVRDWGRRQLVRQVILGDSRGYEEMLDFLLGSSTGQQHSGALVVMAVSGSYDTCIEQVPRALRSDGLVGMLPAGADMAILYLVPCGDLDVVGRKILRRCNQIAGGGCKVRIGTVDEVGLPSRRLYHQLVGELARPRDFATVVAPNEGVPPGIPPDLNAWVEGILLEKDSEIRPVVLRTLVEELTHTEAPEHVIRELMVELVVLFRSQVISVAGADANPPGRGYLAEMQRCTSIMEMARVATDLLLQLESFYRGLHLGRYSWRLARAVDYVLTHLGDNLYLDSVAEVVGISPQHLSRLYKEEMDSTFTRFVNEQRVDRARYLLMSSSLGVGEIAAAVGFRDADYFSKVFRRFCDCTPSEYRNTLGGRRSTDG